MNLNLLKELPVGTIISGSKNKIAIKVRETPKGDKAWQAPAGYWNIHFEKDLERLLLGKSLRGVNEGVAFGVYDRWVAVEFNIGSPIKIQGHRGQNRPT